MAHRSRSLCHLALWELMNIISLHSVKRGLEVIQDNHVTQALENK
jgi:hypothetical protein